MDNNDKKSLSEIDICDLFITPAIRDAGWEPMKQIRREVTLTPDPVIVRSNLFTREARRWSSGITWSVPALHFDAFLIGLTATPTKKTIGFFEQNLVSEYTYEDAVVDKVNVGNDIYRITNSSGTNLVALQCTPKGASARDGARQSHPRQKQIC